ncbi:hypothetical protein KKG29_02140 [Patescibacteria group bacterium]|nr:hypothetical protein [Patescibacteria group bacterium]MBU3999957.1 hypothetical protein [Patescibacteria group bacterium]MBU4056971.1 hypothetical protein [Patescibacteria group bacterium]MBU4368624.1 hypothetical protein [Patescibacteria group bacterium]
MPENYAAMEKGCELFRRIFAKPVYLLIINYLARTYWYSHRRHSRFHEEIEEDVCKNPGVDKEQINWNVFEFLSQSGWIKRIYPKQAGGLIAYEITEQGNQLAVFLRNEEILKLFRP